MLAMQCPLSPLLSLLTENKGEFHAERSSLNTDRATKWKCSSFIYFEGLETYFTDDTAVSVINIVVQFRWGY